MRYRLYNSKGEPMGTFHHRAAAAAALEQWKDADRIEPVHDKPIAGRIMLTDKGKALADSLEATSRKGRAA